MRSDLRAVDREHDARRVPVDPITVRTVKPIALNQCIRAVARSREERVGRVEGAEERPWRIGGVLRVPDHVGEMEPERRVAAQSEQIGIAQSDLYPHITINGTLGGSAEKFSQLFTPGAFNSQISPTFRWDLLNYCRIANNVKLQDARFLELVATYQNTVLTANQEVEDGLIVFLRGQERTQFQQKSVDDAVAAVNVALLQYKAGTTDFTTVTQVEQFQVLQQDVLAQAQGEIVTGLVQVYRALGGGWQIRLQNCQDCLPPQTGTLQPPQTTEELFPPPAVVVPKE